MSLAGWMAFAAGPVWAAEEGCTLTLKDHRYEPTELKVPAGAKVAIRVCNRDDTPEEFESYTLKREKLIPAGKDAVVHVGPLQPGRYPFVGEFHEDTATGVIVVE
jgi:hypothetical protein